MIWAVYDSLMQKVSDTIRLKKKVLHNRFSEIRRQF